MFRPLSSDKALSFIIVKSFPFFDMPTRYDRQLLEFTAEEQGRIRSATVGIVGCGGLGTYVSTALALAGVGTMVMIDPDVPETTNLNRQFVYCRPLSEGDRRHKAEILSEWVCSLNPDVSIEAHVGSFDEATCDLFDRCDVMVDCLDSIGSRMRLNKYCVGSGKPLVHGGISGFTGQLFTIVPGRTACLHCFMRDLSESSVTPPSIGSVVMSVGSMEATEVLKLLSGRGEGSFGKLVSTDFEAGRTVSMRIERDEGCPVCGTYGFRGRA